jgi:L-threonylcarbamoyladenylate synthase
MFRLALRYSRLWVRLLSVQTKLTRSPKTAAEFVKRGGIAAFPTETVYGLGANVFDEHAIAKIFEAKRRPADNPLIAHIGSLDQIAQLVVELPETANRFIAKFFPGPLTLVLKKSERVPLIATAGLDTIGVRMPGNQLANEFLIGCGVPVVAPSANISGKPSPTTWEAVFEDLNERIDCILQGETTVIGLESTVVDCTSPNPTVLRFGAVSLESIREVVPETGLPTTGGSDIARSPGQKHKHYAPNANVIVVEAGAEILDVEAAFIGLEMPGGPPLLSTTICLSADEYAHSLFAFFRDCDKQNIPTIYCQAVEETGIGAALMDRLRRAESR